MGRFNTPPRGGDITGGDFAYKAPLQYIDRAIQHKQAKFDEVGKELDLLEGQYNIEHINDPIENRNADNIKQYYDNKLTDITNKIAENPDDYLKYSNDIRTLSREIQSDKANGDLARLSNSYQGYKDMNAQAKEISKTDPSRANRLRDYALKNWQSNPNRSIDNTFSAPQLLDVKDFNNKFGEIAKGLKPDAEKLGYVEENGNYSYSGTKEYEGVNKGRLRKLMWNKIQSDPSFNDYIDQQALLGYEGYKDNSGKFIEPFNPDGSINENSAFSTNLKFSDAFSYNKVDESTPKLTQTPESKLQIDLDKKAISSFLETSSYDPSNPNTKYLKERGFLDNEGNLRVNRINNTQKGVARETLNPENLTQEIQLISENDSERNTKAFLDSIKSGKSDSKTDRLKDLYKPAFEAQGLDFDKVTKEYKYAKNRLGKKGSYDHSIDSAFQSDVNTRDSYVSIIENYNKQLADYKYTATNFSGINLEDYDNNISVINDFNSSIANTRANFVAIGSGTPTETDFSRPDRILDESEGDSNLQSRILEAANKLGITPNELFEQSQVFEEKGQTYYNVKVKPEYQDIFSEKSVSLSNLANPFELDPYEKEYSINPNERIWIKGSPYKRLSRTELAESIKRDADANNLDGIIRTLSREDDDFVDINKEVESAVKLGTPIYFGKDKLRLEQETVAENGETKKKFVLLQITKEGKEVRNSYDSLKELKADIYQSKTGINLGLKSK